MAADNEAVWLAGDGVVRRISPSGRFATGEIAVDGLQAAAAQGQGLLCLADDGTSTALVQVDGQGRIVARSNDVGDIGAHLANDGTIVWMDDGLKLARFTLLHPVP